LATASISEELTAGGEEEVMGFGGAASPEEPAVPMSTEAPRSMWSTADFGKLSRPAEVS